MEYKKKRRYWRYLISFPFIWAVLFPMILLDIIVELYHRICFPLYGIPCIKRSQYIKMDRYKLPYIKWYDKLNCAYCEYANGFLLYASAIAGETEKYWCGIKHDHVEGFVHPKHHEDFVPHGDEKAFKEKYSKNK